jgi:3-hydroxyacyl-[acyl-carrier-protein] dehydratase
MTSSAIEEAIPHRAPMLLLDEIVQQSERHIVCQKTFTGAELFFQGHYPDYPLVPGVILCEAGMQAGAVLLSSITPRDGRVPVATRMNDVKWKKMVRPGHTIDIEVTLNEQLADVYFLSAKITCDGKLAARYTFACTLAVPEE